MESGIYAIKNTINGKLYVGSAKNLKKRFLRHMSDLRRGVHSSIKLQRSYDKHGLHCFEFIVLEYIENCDDLLVIEQGWIDSLNTIKCGYNIAPANGGDILSNHPNRLEIIERIRKGVHDTLSRMTETERKYKFGNRGSANGMFGKTHSEKVKQNMRDRTVTEETRRRMSEGRKKFFVENPDARKRLSDDASKRTGEDNPFFGKTHSDHTKNLISKANLGRMPKNTIPVVFRGISYKSLSEASRITGLTRYKIAKELLLNA